MQEEVKVLQQKKCYIHKGEDIFYIQVGSKNKLKYPGACKVCITELDLEGQNLVEVDQIQNFCKDQEKILEKFPKLNDKQILKNYQYVYSNTQYIDPQQEIKDFFVDLKSKIETLEKQVLQNVEQELINKQGLIKDYVNICKKGQFVTLFKDFMADDVDNGQNLVQFINDQNQNQQQYQIDLNNKLQAFKKTQMFMQKQQPIQSKLKQMILSSIEMLGQTYIFEDKNDSPPHKISDIYFERFMKLFEKDIIGLDQKMQSKINQFQITPFSNKQITNTFTQLGVKLQNNIQNLPNQQSNPNKQQMQNQVSLPVSNNQQQQQQFQRIQDWTYVFKTELNILNNSITYKNKQKNFLLFDQKPIQVDKQYKILLKFTPFENKIDSYKINVGFEELFKGGQFDSEKKIDYLLSNSADKTNLNIQVLQGKDFKDPTISHSEEMRKLGLYICLKNHQFHLFDFPKKENQIAVTDEKLQKLIKNQNLNFFVQTNGIQKIEFIDFRIIDQN